MYSMVFIKGLENPILFGKILMLLEHYTILGNEEAVQYKILPGHVWEERFKDVSMPEKYCGPMILQ